METDMFREYAENNWMKCKSSVTDLSSNHQTGVALVESDASLYDFDKICASLFPAEDIPSSADGMLITSKSVILIEFKSGFKDRITKNNFDREEAKCLETGKICEDYWKLFDKNRKREKSELIISIHQKALESYITLRNHVFTQFPEGMHIPLELIVVADGDDIDSMENTLNELTGEPITSPNNHFEDLRKSLRKLSQKCLTDNKVYCYHKIIVMSADDFKNWLKDLDGIF